MDGVVLKRSEYVKFLGVLIDDRLQINDYLSLIFMFEYKNGNLPDRPIFNNFFSPNNSVQQYETHQQNLYHVFPFKTTFYQFSIRYKGSKIWNRISEYLKQIQTLYLFKNKIKQYIPTLCWRR